VDKGNSWEKGRAPISGSSPNFVVTALVRNAHPDGWFMEAQITDNPLVFVGMRYLLLAIRVLYNLRPGKLNAIRSSMTITKWR
jgi:hypothetical protein